MKTNAWKIILAIAVLVCIVCLGRFGWIKYQDHKTEQARKETLKAIARTEFTGENDGDEPEKVPAGVKHGQQVDFKKLIKINSDIMHGSMCQEQELTILWHRIRKTIPTI